MKVYLERADLERLSKAANVARQVVSEYVRDLILGDLEHADRSAKDVPGDRAARLARRRPAAQERLPLADTGERVHRVEEPAKVSLDDVVLSTTHREYAADSVEMMVAKRTGHEAGCGCMQCVQTTRFIEQQRKAAEPKKEKKR